MLWTFINFYKHRSRWRPFCGGLLLCDVEAMMEDGLMGVWGGGGGNDRIMNLRAPLADDRHMSILSFAIISFYGALRRVITSILKEEKLLLMGDFNARVGRQRNIWNMFSRYGNGNVNSNGLNLLQLCSELNFAICNTFFRKNTKWHGLTRDQNMVTWLTSLSQEEMI